MGYAQDGRGSIPGGNEIFLFSTASRPPLGLTQAASLQIKRPGREADHSPLSASKVKNGGAISPPPASLWCDA
jgi:hypothetical protein